MKRDGFILPPKNIFLTMRKITIFIGFLVLLCLCTSCGSGSRKTADKFLTCLEKQDYERASVYCGLSKDADSQEMAINAMLEYFGTNIRSHEITGDSLLADKEHAIIIVNLTRNNNIRELDVPVFMDRRDGTWYVNPFIREY